MANEKIGNTDHYKRRKAQMRVLKIKADLFEKYPELKTIPIKTFSDFYNENKKYKITPTELKNYFEKLSIEKKQ